MLGRADSMFGGWRGNGIFTISGSELAVNAGGLDAKGVIKPGEYIELGSQRYSFAMKM